MPSLLHTSYCTYCCSGATTPAHFASSNMVALVAHHTSPYHIAKSRKIQLQPGCLTLSPRVQTSPPTPDAVLPAQRPSACNLHVRPHAINKIAINAHLISTAAARRATSFHPTPYSTPKGKTNLCIHGTALDAPEHRSAPPRAAHSTAQHSTIQYSTASRNMSVTATVVDHVSTRPQHGRQQANPCVSPAHPNEAPNATNHARSQVGTSL